MTNEEYRQAIGWWLLPNNQKPRKEGCALDAGLTPNQTEGGSTPSRSANINEESQ